MTSNNLYVVRIYNGPTEHVYEVSGPSADVVLGHAASQHFPAVRTVTSTSRHQMSPLAADRDNRHSQFDQAGRKGIAVRRKETDLAAAEHRNDVEVARKWVAGGRKLADLKKYGGYASVCESDLG